MCAATPPPLLTSQSLFSKFFFITYYFRHFCGKSFQGFVSNLFGPDSPGKFKNNSAAFEIKWGHVDNSEGSEIISHLIYEFESDIDTTAAIKRYRSVVLHQIISRFTTEVSRGPSQLPSHSVEVAKGQFELGLKSLAIKKN